MVVDGACVLFYIFVKNFENIKDEIQQLFIFAFCTKPKSSGNHKPTVSAKQKADDV